MTNDYGMFYRTSLLLMMILFTFTRVTVARELARPWEAVLTTDTDVVYSIQLPRDSYEGFDYAEFPVKVDRPDGQIEQYTVKLWSNGEGTYKPSDSVAPFPAPKQLDQESPLGLIHKRVFFPQEFREWDDSLQDLGPRNQELLNARSHGTNPNHRSGN